MAMKLRRHNRGSVSMNEGWTNSWQTEQISELGGRLKRAQPLTVSLVGHVNGLACYELSG